jgi:putative isomerase
MFDFQDEMGMIPDCVYRDTLIENHNWRDTKPPLSAWATWSVFESSGDENFLTEILPKIEKYHNWWYQYRDIDQNGLCEYGSTDGSLVAAKWESGMDNAVRFDDAKMVKNKLGGSMDRESVDLNAYLFSEKEYLSKILAQLGNSKKAEQYKVEAEELKAQIQELFFDEESEWYYDISLESKKHLKTFGAEGWIPLWAKVATEKQAVLIHQKMTDTALFATYIPFPTLAANHPDFKPDRGYWRGPVWLDQAYFAIQGLRNYGINDDALLFTHQLFDRLQGLKDNDLPIRENYHPLTGEGMESQHFSWSAAHLLMLLIEQ